MSDNLGSIIRQLHDQVSLLQRALRDQLPLLRHLLNEVCEDENKADCSITWELCGDRLCEATGCVAIRLFEVSKALNQTGAAQLKTAETAGESS